MNSFQLRRLVKHLPHYMPLLGILFFGFWGFYTFSYDRIFQLAVAVGVSFGYVTWGVVHHHIHNDLSLEVVLEYIFVSLLGMVLVFSMISAA